MSLTWSARNQLSAISGTGEAYDGLGRRVSSGGADFEYDGAAMIGWSSGYGVSYNFLTLPGGGALAGTFTNIFGVQTTSVPLIDASGSTIALVNAASTQSPPATTYTYDPAGNPTVSGTANDWPFQYQGMEKEFTDPGPYYYTGGGQFYSAQIMRSPSETGQTSSSGSGGGPAGNGGGGGGGGGGSNPFLPAFNPIPTSGSQIAGSVVNQAEAAGAGLAAYGALWGTSALVAALTAGEVAIPVVGWIAAVGTGLFELFDELFGGGSSEPPTPRQLRHQRHPLYPVILGFPDGLIPDQVSKGLKVCGDPYPSKTPPLQRVKDPTPSPTAQPTPGNTLSPLDVSFIRLLERILGPERVRQMFTIPNPPSFPFGQPTPDGQANPNDYRASLQGGGAGCGS